MSPSSSTSPTVLFILSLTLAVFSFFTPLTRAATTNDTCQAACSDWSVVLGNCRTQWPETTTDKQSDLTYMNGFLSCCCQGSESTNVLGNATMKQSADTCSNCSSTPWVIKDNLVQLTSLCAVQASNGTASDAIDFRPEAYTTAGDGSNVTSSASRASRRAEKAASSKSFTGALAVTFITLLCGAAAVTL